MPNFGHDRSSQTTKRNVEHVKLRQKTIQLANTTWFAAVASQHTGPELSDSQQYEAHDYRLSVKESLMYCTSSLKIDPSQLTHIEIKQPTKAFGKLLHFLTAGLTSEKEEMETLTAVSVLQQFNRVFRAMGITNIVRLAKDTIDFYLDTEGRQDDLKEALEQFELETDHYESELFETLYLVVEHSENALQYLIEVDIMRRHRVGAYPITVTVNSVFTDFAAGPGERAAEVQQKMQPVFQSQESYEQFLAQRRAMHDRFVYALAIQVRTYMQVDDVIVTSKTNMVRPKRPVSSPEDIRHRDRYDEPIYYGYPGWDDLFFYAYLWSTLTHEHHIYVHDTSIVDEGGHAMMDVGATGFNGGATDTLNPEAQFEPPLSGDVEYFDSHDFQGDFDAAQLHVGGYGLESADLESDGWFDSFRNVGGDASCSSCSNCGGGCSSE